MRGVFLADFALIACLSACASAPCECPDFEVPAVVEVQVLSPLLLPTPSPPIYQECVDLKAAYHNFLEADMAYEACVAIIEENNE